VYRLGIYLDRAYPLIVSEAQAAVELCMPLNRATVIERKDENMNVVLSYSQHWPCLFPQHAPGLKHRRRIWLEPWQREILDEHRGDSCGG
jgi:hypothetical protein